MTDHPDQPAQTDKTGWAWHAAWQITSTVLLVVIFAIFFIAAYRRY